MLAIDGGDKVRSEAFPKRRLFAEGEREAALALFDAALRSGDAIGYNGVEEQAYEREFAVFMGGGYADLVNSGASVLYVALAALHAKAALGLTRVAIVDYDVHHGNGSQQAFYEDDEVGVEEPDEGEVAKDKNNRLFRPSGNHGVCSPLPRPLPE